MNKEFRLPDVGEGLTEADIVSWHVKPGDLVTVNQVIVDIETAKAVVELPSPYAGTVTALLVEEGQTIDVATITASVARTGRCVVAHEAPVYAGLGAEIAARVTEQCFYHLEAPVLRVGGFATPYPAARSEDHYLPDLDRILDAVDRTFAF